jgi:hypothetical protein
MIAAIYARTSTTKHAIARICRACCPGVLVEVTVVVVTRCRLGAQCQGGTPGIACKPTKHCMQGA